MPIIHVAIPEAASPKYQAMVSHIIHAAMREVFDVKDSNEVAIEMTHNISLCTRDQESIIMRVEALPRPDETIKRLWTQLSAKLTECEFIKLRPAGLRGTFFALANDAHWSW